jgi:hypothetical protein
MDYMSLGTVLEQVGNKLYITAETWSRVLWTRSMGMRLANGASVVAVDLDQMCIHLNNNHEAYEPGQEVHRDIEIVGTVQFGMTDVLNIVQSFSYKPGYKLEVITNQIVQGHDFNLKLSARFEDGSTYYKNMVISYRGLRGFNATRLRETIFKMIVELEESVIRSRLRYNDIPYLIS